MLAFCSKKTIQILIKHIITFFFDVYNPFVLYNDMLLKDKIKFTIISYYQLSWFCKCCYRLHLIHLCPTVRELGGCPCGYFPHNVMIVHKMVIYKLSSLTDYN